MIQLENLKENTLLISESDYQFNVYKGLKGFTGQVFLSSYKDHEYRSSILILLTRISPTANLYQRWLCFCCGKICEYRIEFFDCKNTKKL
jgi:hypothetical protein